MFAPKREQIRLGLCSLLLAAYPIALLGQTDVKKDAVRKGLVVYSASFHAPKRHLTFTGINFDINAYKAGPPIVTAGDPRTPLEVVDFFRTA